MLNLTLIHPEILAVLGRAGHGSKVLIADGNYPFSTKLGPKAKLVSLNLAPGIITCTQAFEVIVSAVPIEDVVLMDTLKEGPYTMKEEPPIWREFAEIAARFSYKNTISKYPRETFYKNASSSDVALTIATGERRIYANILITIGVVMSG